MMYLGLYVLVVLLPLLVCYWLRRSLAWNRTDVLSLLLLQYAGIVGLWCTAWWLAI